MAEPNPPSPTFTHPLPSWTHATPSELLRSPSNPWDNDYLHQIPFGFIDLTADLTSPTPPSPMRRLRSTEDERSRESSGQPSTKRRRIDIVDISEGTPRANDGVAKKEIEEVDLRDVDDDNSLFKVLEQQRADAIKSQKEQSNKPLRFSTQLCVVCMENMTNITSTHCGHLFCHTCLMEALIAGENQGSDPGKALSRCPICRKKVLRGKDKKSSGMIIPLELKVRSKSTVAKGKEKAMPVP